MMTLEGKVALVTGAGRGQGRADSLALARDGADVVVTDIGHDIPLYKYAMASEADLEETARQVRALGRKALALTCDVRDAGQVEAVVEAATAEFGRLDILVNNAGVAEFVAAHRISEEQWDTMIDILLKGPWLMCRAAIPHFIRQRSGRIVNIASVAGLLGLETGSHYAAGKAGLIGFTRSLAKELRHHGNITVNAICPGSVESDMTVALGERMGLDREAMKTNFATYHLLPSILQPEDIAEMVAFLASDRARFITGVAFPVDAGWTIKNGRG